MKPILFLFTLLTLLSCQEKNATKKESFKEKETHKNLPNNHLEKKEKELLEIQNKMEGSLENLRNDSLLRYSNYFTKEFSDLLASDSNTLTYPFSSLAKNTKIKIISSEDHRLRVYSWDDQSGGSMRFYNQAYQWSENQKVHTQIHTNTTARNGLEEEGLNPRGYFSKVYTIKNKENQSIYLVIENGKYSNRDLMQQITAYQIDNNQLIATPVFKTPKEQLSSIYVGYDFSSVVDRPERPIEIITLQENTLLVALVTEKGVVTSKNLIYEWNGQFFQFTKVE